MPEKALQILGQNRSRFAIAVGGLVLALIASGLVVGSASGQVSDSELNQLARDAASNRNASLSSQTARASGIDFFSLIIKGGVFMIPIGVTSLMVVTFVFDRWIGLRSGKILPKSLRKNLVQLTRNGDLDPREVYRICGDSSSAAARIFRTMVLKTGRQIGRAHV